MGLGRICELLLLGVVGREGGRPMCNGRVPFRPLESDIDGARVRCVGNGGARDIANTTQSPLQLEQPL